MSRYDDDWQAYHDSLGSDGPPLTDDEVQALVDEEAIFLEDCADAEAGRRP